MIADAIPTVNSSSDVRAWLGHVAAQHIPCVPTDRVLLASRLKVATVGVLGLIVAWRPGLAAYLGKLVTRVWRGFGRA